MLFKLTVGAGHFDGAAVLKQSFIERQALIYKRAMLRLLDGSSGGGTIDLVLEMGRTYVPWVDGFFVMSKLLKIVRRVVRMENVMFILGNNE